MMKQTGKLHSFFSGVLVTVLILGLGIPALAANLVTKELYYNNIQIRLNGQTLLPKDANGNTVEPFVIDGTTYLPIRAVGEALGLNVAWDGATQTVILGNDVQMGQPAAWLGEMEPFTGRPGESTVKDQQYNGDSTANNGDTFDRYYWIGDRDGVSYLLKGQYNRFTGTWYLCNIYKNSSENYRFLVYADGVLVYTSPAVTAGVEPVAFDVDISGCYEMKLVQQSLNGDTWSNDYGSGGRIANAALWTH